MEPEKVIKELVAYYLRSFALRCMDATGSSEFLDRAGLAISSLNAMDLHSSLHPPVSETVHPETKFRLLLATYRGLVASLFYQYSSLMLNTIGTPELFDIRDEMHQHIMKTL